MLLLRLQEITSHQQKLRWSEKRLHPQVVSYQGHSTVYVSMHLGCELNGLTYQQARAIINSHFLRPDHGIQGEGLCQQLRYTQVYIPCYHGGSRISYTETWNTAIIGDELFVSTSREYKSTTGNRDVLKAFAGVLRKGPRDHVYDDLNTLISHVEINDHTPGS